ncbi:hypothetical protein F1880_009416 [Penicillium rolfsii]|nr:hypothetical protein F1880_009416 [Penicillium rolfsii]
MATSQDGQVPSLFAENLETASKQSQLRCGCAFLRELASWCEQLPAGSGVFSTLLPDHVTKQSGERVRELPSAFSHGAYTAWLSSGLRSFSAVPWISWLHVQPGAEKLIASSMSIYAAQHDT